MHVNMIKWGLYFIWLPLLTCSPVGRDNNRRNSEPYGYAPYVWISVSQCNLHTGWCQGKSKGSFALTVDIQGDHATDGTCTHYCPGEIYAYWRPSKTSAGDLSKYEKERVMLGAYVFRLDKSSCREVPGKFPCSDRVVSTIPINKISVMLHASPRNKEYYFGDDPMAQCDPDPQCAAYKLLRRTLYASPQNRTWPTTDEVLNIRNSAYACVLTYVGLGDSESISLCYTQLGDNCFGSEGNNFCISQSDTSTLGITNADGDASAPIAICEVSSSSEMQHRDRFSRPTAREIGAFISPSLCDATVLPVDKAVYNSSHVSLDLDMEKFHIVSELGHVIMRVSLDECLVPISYRQAGYSSMIRNIAEALYKTMIATYSTAIMLDASYWGATVCSQSERSDVAKVANDLASALVKLRVVKLFLRLPRFRKLLDSIDF